MVPDLTMGVFGAEVTVTVGGRDYTSFVDCIRENVNAGFTADDKFRLTAAEVLPAAQMAQVLDAIERLEQFTDVRRFTRLLGRASRSAVRRRSADEPPPLRLRPLGD